ncbi:MAG TPA: class I SAM-dependent methyltransferase [bacterium]|nr:class I SAM-dependent methyltransferase [bacterium]HPN31557.1 class I SAM-dependent methyltransferase [bacterium]
MKNSTINYYNSFAENYFNNTVAINLDKLYERIEFFFDDKSEKLLDLGCGSGRDSHRLLKKNFKYIVSADLSEKLLKLASANFKLNRICLMNFLNVSFKNESFKYIFANASLLHIKKKYIIDTFSELYKILKKNGRIYFSLKKGTGEGEDENNRFFSYYLETEIIELLKITGLECLSISSLKSSDSRNIEWISVFAEK